MSRLFSSKSYIVFGDEYPHSFCYLSLSSRAKFVEDNNNFLSVHHYIAYHKARLAEDKRMMKMILMTENVDLVLSFANSIIGLDEEKWKSHHYSVLKRGLILKFTQNRDLLVRLLLTNSKKIIYANKDDSFYGNGTRPEDEVYQESKWNGFNVLGFTIMRIRNELDMQLRKCEECRKVFFYETSV